ncbi:copper resistance CopC family protein [Streptosporangium sp. NPDC051023]|uniref:copper resistance CopC family protein n=1 Tax=Streptosporangium sp. NPDC051023 TaxID=3155410 RepID=UPI0034504059
MAYLPRFIRRTVLAMVCSGILLLLTAPAALAHDRLKSSSPAQGAVVSSIERIELEFSAHVQFPTVVLRKADGTQAAIGKPVAEGPTVTAEVAGPLPAGGYVIAWRVVSSDGHPIEGEIPFTVSGSAASAPTAPTAQVSSPPPPPPTTSPSATSVADGRGASPGVPWWIWGGLAALAVIGVIVWSRTPRRDDPPAAEE